LKATIKPLRRSFESWIFIHWFFVFSRLSAGLQKTATMEGLGEFKSGKLD
jgi:hypothetical protein